MEEIEFDWDQWNIQKNEEKHGISTLEAESTFFDKKLKLYLRERHQRKNRMYMKNKKEILDYDNQDTTPFIDVNKPLKLSDIGLKLPAEPPTKVISIRIPTGLYNNIRAYSTNIDIPYQSTIKMLLEKGIKNEQKFKISNTNKLKLKKAS